MHIPTLLTSLALSLSFISATPVSTPPSLSARQTATTWPKIAFNSTFLYDLDNVGKNVGSITSMTGVKVDAKVLIVDGEGVTSSLINQYHAAGKQVICYFSAGSFEPFRTDLSSIPDSCFCGPSSTYNKSTQKCSSDQSKLDGWDEYWFNVRDATCLSKIKPVMSARMKTFKAKGCDGVDPDNMDSYANDQPYDTTEKDQLNYLLWLSSEAHRLGLAVDLKNAGDLIEDYPTELSKAFDFNVIESCTQYKECSKYDPFLALNKPQIRIEYGKRLSTTSCPTLPAGVRLLQYSKDSLDSSLINLSCPK